MTLQSFIVVFFSTLILSSCVHTPVKQELKQPMTSLVVMGAVLDPELLAQGGNLALAPFRAGSQAEANDELDRLSMMILKGIKDGVEEQVTLLHIIGENEGQPKMVLQGYVEEYSKTGRMSRMMMHPDENILTLKGEIWLSSNGARLLNFSVQKKFFPKKEKPDDVAYALGHDIGNFIVAHSKEKL